jgi:hypothetical protein
VYKRYISGTIKWYIKYSVEGVWNLLLYGTFPGSYVQNGWALPQIQQGGGQSEERFRAQGARALRLFAEEPRRRQAGTSQLITGTGFF